MIIRFKIIFKTDGKRKFNVFWYLVVGPLSRGFGGFAGIRFFVSF